MFFALLAVAGAGYAFMEPILAYGKLVTGEYSFGPELVTALAAGRLKEAAWPLIGGTVFAIAALALTALSRGPKGLNIASYALGGIAAAGSLTIWAMYGGGILSHLM